MLRPTKRLLALLTAALALSLFGGCAGPWTSDWHTSDMFDLKKPWPFKDDDKPKKGTPVRMASTWTDTILRQGGATPQRGFGGRVMFYAKEGNEPILVDGQFVVYAFDETNREPTDNKPTRRYVFPPEQVAVRESKSELGASYSFWLPWDEVGGPQTNISLICRFEPKKGSVIVGEQTQHLLPGELRPNTMVASNTPPKLPDGHADAAGRSADVVHHAGASQRQPRLHSARRQSSASGQLSERTIGAATAAEPLDMASRRMTTTSINLPESFQRRTVLDAASQSSGASISAADHLQAIAAQRPGQSHAPAQLPAAATPQPQPIAAPQPMPRQSPPFSRRRCSAHKSLRSSRRIGAHRVPSLHARQHVDDAAAEQQLRSGDDRSAAIRLAAASGTHERSESGHAATRSSNAGRSNERDASRRRHHRQLPAGWGAVSAGDDPATVIWFDTWYTPGSSDTSFSITSRWLSLSAVPVSTTVSPSTSMPGAAIFRAASNLSSARGAKSPRPSIAAPRRGTPTVSLTGTLSFAFSFSPVCLPRLALTQRAIELLEELVRAVAHRLHHRLHVAAAAPDELLAALAALSAVSTLAAARQLPNPFEPKELPNEPPKVDEPPNPLPPKPLNPPVPEPNWPPLRRIRSTRIRSSQTRHRRHHYCRTHHRRQTRRHRSHYFRRRRNLGQKRLAVPNASEAAIPQTKNVARSMISTSALHR